MLHKVRYIVGFDGNEIYSFAEIAAQKATAHMTCFCPRMEIAGFGCSVLMCDLHGVNKSWADLRAYS
jgi:hypothetical protein